MSTAETVDRSSTVTALPSARYPERFLTMFASASRFLSQIDRPAAYYRVLFAAMGRLDWADTRRFSSRQAAEACAMSRSNAERALAMLEADRVIIATGRSSDKERRLSRRLGWNGGAASFLSREEAERDPELIDARGRAAPGRRAAVGAGAAPVGLS